MKKSLKVIATATLAFSMFASVAMAAETTTPASTITAATKVKTSKDFTDLAGLDAALLAKVDALLAKDYMDGKTETTFDVTGNMTRAEAAKLVTKIFGLTVGTETSSSFKDIDGTDTSIAWSIPFIEAAKKAGIIDGMTDTTFAPKDNVTLGQLATLLVKGFKKSGDVKVTTPWYQGYLDVAKAAGVDLGTDGAKFATRGDLVVGSYAADVAVQASKSGTINVSELKATGVKTLVVNFASPVGDTSKATVAITKGAAKIALASNSTVVWNKEKTSATLTLDAKLNDGTYTATVTTTDTTATVVKAVADVTVTNEKITKIDFTTANDSIAKASAVKVSFKALNQYGEQSDLTASAFTYAISPTGIQPQQSSDSQYITIDTSNMVKDTTVAITVIAPEGATQATKVFKVGDSQSIAKVELGDLKLASGKTKLVAGDTATIAFTAYDQYGAVVTAASQLQTGTTPINTNPSAVTNFVFNNAGELEITTSSTLTVDTDVSLSIVPNASGTVASKTVKISAASAPKEVAFGTYSDVIAEGDTVYLPLIVKDQDGTELTADQIVTNAQALVSKFNVFTTNSSVVGNAAIETTGANRGKVRLTGLVKGNATVSVFVNSTSKSANYSVSVQAARVPSTIYVSTAAKDKLLPYASSAVKFKLKDQYGKDSSANNSAYSVDFKLEKTSGADAGAVETSGLVELANGDTDSVNIAAAYDVAINLNSTADLAGTFKLTAKLTKVAVVVNGVTTVAASTISTSSVSVEAIKASAADSLTYAVDTLGTIYAGAGSSTWNKTIAVSAKDASGATVAVPSSTIQSVTVGNTNYATTSGAVVHGAAKGNTNLTVIFAPVAGNVKSATQDLVVSDVLPAVDSITVANATKTWSLAATNANPAGNGTLDSKFVWDANLAGTVTAKDQYGISLVNENVTPTTTLLGNDGIYGVRYFISNVKWSGAAGTLTVGSSNGQITYVAGAAGSVPNSFTITAIAPNGKSATSTITVTH